MGLPFSIQRALVLAPHPDDDVIAAGGLIQRVLEARGDVHVVFITDGENNPWPQRFIERKFFIEAGDRAKWGAMRRREALCSLARLGIGESSATFLAFPDQGIATLARRGDMRLRDALRAVVEKVQPTVIITPSSFDLHPDHRAISYFAHTALTNVASGFSPTGRAEARPHIVTYVVHGAAPSSRLAGRLELTEDEQRRKREAIECHVSQLALSRERFLWYAQTTESFYAPEFDLVRVESLGREWWTACRHALRVCFGLYPTANESGVQPAADVEHRPGDVAGLL